MGAKTCLAVVVFGWSAERPRIVNEIILISKLGGPIGNPVDKKTSLIAVPSNLNVRRPFLELTLKVNGIRIAIAIGLNGLLVAFQRLDQRVIVAVGKWPSRR